MAIICSCRRGGGSFGIVGPITGLNVECLENNLFPLIPYGPAEKADTAVCLYEFMSQDCLCNYSPLLVCLGAGEGEVTVNGVCVAPVEGLHQIDSMDVCYVLSGIVREGNNRVELHGCPVAPAVYVAGNFSARQSESGTWFIAPAQALSTGSMIMQGLPFFRGEVSFTKGYELAENTGRRILEIPRWEGLSCGLWINGKKVSDVSHGRKRINVSRFTTPGPNYFEIRVSSHDTNVPGSAAPVDFGLFGDFDLK